MVALIGKQLCLEGSVLGKKKLTLFVFFHCPIYLNRNIDILPSLNKLKTGDPLIQARVEMVTFPSQAHVLRPAPTYRFGSSSPAHVSFVFLCLGLPSPQFPEIFTPVLSRPWSWCYPASSSRRRHASNRIRDDLCTIPPFHVEAAASGETRAEKKFCEGVSQPRAG